VHYLVLCNNITTITVFVPVVTDQEQEIVMSGGCLFNSNMFIWHQEQNGKTISMPEKYNFFWMTDGRDCMI